ncbi:hypothetical protein B0H11DRAFT_2186271 [Mycena galericulata]|nr:hypothetical protein B0H11DRAFT_2186271 [Mycena galericulata]
MFPRLKSLENSVVRSREKWRSTLESCLGVYGEETGAPGRILRLLGNIVGVTTFQRSLITFGIKRPARSIGGFGAWQRDRRRESPNHPSGALTEDTYNPSTLLIKYGMFKLFPSKTIKTIPLSSNWISVTMSWRVLRVVRGRCQLSRSWLTRAGARLCATQKSIGARGRRWRFEVEEDSIMYKVHHMTRHVQKPPNLQLRDMSEPWCMKEKKEERKKMFKILLKIFPLRVHLQVHSVKSRSLSNPAVLASACSASHLRLASISSLFLVNLPPFPLRVHSVPQPVAGSLYYPLCPPRKQPLGVYERERVLSEPKQRRNQAPQHKCMRVTRIGLGRVSRIFVHKRLWDREPDHSDVRPGTPLQLGFVENKMISTDVSRREREIPRESKPSSMLK